MYSILAQKGVINEALNVNQSYCWSLKDFASQAGSACISSMHINSCAVNSSDRDDDLHKPCRIIKR